MSRLTLDGRLGSLMNCMLCLQFDIEHVSVSLYVFITKHTNIHSGSAYKDDVVHITGSLISQYLFS